MLDTFSYFLSLKKKKKGKEKWAGGETWGGDKKRTLP